MSDTQENAEGLALGAMMLDSGAVWAAQHVIRPADFGDPRNETIADVIFALASAGVSTDPLSVSDELRRRGHMRGNLDAAYVHSLTTDVFTPRSVGRYASIVARHAKLRRLRLAAGTIIEQADEGGDVDALVAEAQSVLASASGDTATLSTVGESMHRVLTELESGEEPFTPTRWPELNKYIHGLKPGTLNVIAARPGSGKTIMGLQIAADLATTGAVSFSSLEMSEGDLIKRLIAAESDVHLSALSRNRLAEDEWHRVEAAQERIDMMQLFIDDRAGVTLEQIESRARRIANRGPLAGVVVDYLQLLSSGRRVESRQVEVAAFSRRLKLMSKDLNVPVIALSQINRESEKTRRLPSTADLRESGAIEQDADTVMLLARRRDEEDYPTDELDLVIGKNRQGPQGRVTLLWEGQYGRLTSTPWAHLAERGER